MEAGRQTDNWDVEKIRKDFPVLWQTVNGKPLVYRRHDDKHFILYAVGENGVDDGGDAIATKLTNWERDLYLVTLTDIAYICLSPMANLLGQNAGFLQDCLAFRLHFAEQPIGLTPVQVIDATGPGAHEVKGKWGSEKPNRTHDSRSKRHDQSWRT